MVAGGQVLNPLRSERYAANFDSFRFACNIYASDLIDLFPQGAWLPKVQFSNPQRVRRNAQELANRGHAVVFSAGSAAKTAHVGVVVPDLSFLSTAEKAAMVNAQDVLADGATLDRVWDDDNANVHRTRKAPLRSQAGAINGHGIRNGTLVLREDPTLFRTPGYFVYDPTLDQSRGHDVDR